MPAVTTTAKRMLRLARGGSRVVAARLSGGAFPFSMTFILTNRCNFRCEYCNIPDAAAEEMSGDEFKGALTELAGMGLVRASFSGGEALVRDDAIEIIGHARSLGLQTSLNSNGWFAVDKLDALAEVLDLLVVSLDGPEKVHDLVRRQARSYERVISVLDGARERGLATATITVLSRSNLHVMDDVIALARAHGFYCYFQPAYDNCFDHRDGFDESFDHRIFADVAERLDAARARGEPIGASAGYVARLENGPHFGDCSRCSAGRFWGTVLPHGEMIPCHLLRDDPGGTPWPSGRAVGFAEAFRRLHRAKRGPGCAISPYQETDLIFGLDPRAIKAAVWRLAGNRAQVR